MIKTISSVVPDIYLKYIFLSNLRDENANNEVVLKKIVATSKLMFSMGNSGQFWDVKRRMTPLRV